MLLTVGTSNPGGGPVPELARVTLSREYHSCISAHRSYFVSVRIQAASAQSVFCERRGLHFLEWISIQSQCRVALKLATV